MTARKSFRKWLPALVAVTFLFCTSVAAAGTKWSVVRLPVLYGPLRLVVNGQEWRPQARAFVLQKEGVVMVPVREFAALLGVPVSWDAASNTVIIGREAGSGSFPTRPAPAETGLPKAPTSYTWLEDLPVLRNVGPFYRQPGRNFRIAARAFSRGVAVELEANGEAETVVDLGGRYHGAEGYLGADDTTNNSRGSFVVSFYGDEVLLFQSPPIKPADYPYYVSGQLARLSGVKRLRIHVRWVKAGLGDYDRLICVLARFRFFR